MESTHTDALIYATGWTVIHSLWQALVIALVLSIVLISTPRRLAHWRYSCAGIALLLVLLAGGATFYHYFNQALSNIGEEVAYPLMQFSTNAGTTNENFWVLWQARFTAYFNQHLPLIVTVWLCGLSFFILRMLGGLAYIRQLRHQGTRPVQEEWEEVLRELAHKLGIKRPVGLLESLRVQAPVVIGHFKPLILLPIGLLAGLNVNQVEAILAHELAHIYRRDYLLNIIQTLIEALFYFNPGVWWISTCIRVEREHCCDDIAVNLCQNNLEYAKALVSIKELHRGATPQMAMAALGKKKLLLTRIQRILHQPVNTSDMSEKIMVTGMLAFMLVCLNLKAERKAPVTNWERVSASTSTAIVTPPIHPVADTLPEGKITIRTNRDGKRIEAKLIDRKIQELIVDGKEVPAAEYKGYEETLNEIVASVPPPPPPPHFPGVAPRVPGEVPHPNIPSPPKVPLPPKGEGYYYYNKGDEQIIIEMPKNRMGFNYDFKFKDGRNFDFKFKDDGPPFGSDRTIVIDGMDSTEVAFFKEPFKFKSFERFNIKMDSMRIKMDTAQLRRLKLELGQMGHLKEELREKFEKFGYKMDERQFYGDAPHIKIDPKFRFDMRPPGPPNMKRFGSTKDRIEQTLINDELIKAEGRYTFELTDKYLKIDGKKMPDTLFEKYRKIYEESTGIKLETESKVLLSN